MHNATPLRSRSDGALAMAAHVRSASAPPWHAPRN